MPSPPPAVLLGGERIAVSAARSIAALGASVHALGDKNDPIQWSNACSQFVPVGSKGNVLERYLHWLDHEAPEGAVVLPCDDEGIELVARHRARLAERGLRAIEGDDDVMLAMLDKQRTVELAREAGVPTPRTAQPAGDAELRAVADEFAYPCALKPVSSYLFAARFGVLKKVVMVHDREELIREYSALFELGVPMQVTEVIPGPDTAYSSLYSYLDE